MTRNIDRDRLGHDDFIMLNKWGTEADLEPLIVSLYIMNPENINAEEQPFICTYIHCLEAIRTISGRNIGFTYSDYRKWYLKEYGVDLNQSKYMKTFPKK